MFPAGKFFFMNDPIPNRTILAESTHTCKVRYNDRFNGRCSSKVHTINATAASCVKQIATRTDNTLLERTACNLAPRTRSHSSRTRWIISCRGSRQSQRSNDIWGTRIHSETRVFRLRLPHRTGNTCRMPFESYRLLTIFA